MIVANPENIIKFGYTKRDPKYMAAEQVGLKEKVIPYLEDRTQRT